VTIVKDGAVIAGSDGSVKFTYEDASTPKLTSQNTSTATPQGNFYNLFSIRVYVC